MDEIFLTHFRALLSSAPFSKKKKLNRDKKNDQKSLRENSE